MQLKCTKLCGGAGPPYMQPCGCRQILLLMCSVELGFHRQEASTLRPVVFLSKFQAALRSG